MTRAVHMYVLGALVSLLTIFFGILDSIQGSAWEAADGAESDYVREQMDEIFGRDGRLTTRRRRATRGGADATSAIGRRRSSSGGHRDGQLLRKGVGRQQPVLLGETTALRLYGH